MYTAVLACDVFLIGDLLCRSFNEQRSRVDVVRVCASLDLTDEIYKMRPDLLIIAMKNLGVDDWIDRVAALRSASPRTRVVLLYGEDSTEQVSWLAKTNPAAADWSFVQFEQVQSAVDLCNALERIAMGQTLRIPEVPAAMLNEAGCNDENGSHVVTKRELQALRSLVAEEAGSRGLKGPVWSLSGLIRRKNDRRSTSVVT